MQALTTESVGKSHYQRHYKSVQVFTPTHRKLSKLKASTGISIARLIGQAVDGLEIPRRKKRKLLA